MSGHFNNFFDNLISLFNSDLLTHSYNVAFISYLLARELNLPEVQVKRVSIGGLLHDIGKIKIPNNILYKKGRLNKSEFEIIQKHCDYGVEILKQNEEFIDYLPIVKYHHEKWDGSGYNGLRELRIPFEARIVSIADAFDAMTSVRAYQKSKNMREALKEISKCSGTQFEPDLVNAFDNALTKLINGKNAYEFYKLVSRLRKSHK